MALAKRTPLAGLGCLNLHVGHALEVVMFVFSC